MRKARLLLILLPFFVSIIFSSPMHTHAACTDTPSGLVSWWRAQDNANDQLSVNNSTLQNDATFAPGQVGQAFSLDGTDDFVQVASPSGLPVGSSPRTMMAWFKTPRNLSSSTESAIVQYGTVAGAQMFGLITSGNAPGKLYFYGHGSDMWGTTTIQPDTWYHGAVTYDGATVRLYVNGQEEKNTAYALNTVIDAGGLTIGYRSSGSRWQGLIDEVAVFGSALSAAEIQAIYNAGSDGMCCRCDPAPDTFTFIDQAGMPLATQIVSNPVTITGIDMPSPISITGGDYAISTNGGSTWGDWTSTSDNATLNDQIKVRLTSGSTNDNTTSATLTIGGVSDTFSVTTAAAADPKATGLVAWWKADNNALDSVGGYHGIPQGGVTFTDGQVGQAFNLDGAGGFINVSNGELLQPTSAITLAAWIYPKDTGTDQHIFSTAGGGPSPFGHDFYIRITGGSLEFRINDDPLWAGGVLPAANHWYHVAATYAQGAGERRLYVNGVLVNSNGYGSAINNGHTYVTLGVNGRRMTEGGFNTFNGYMDDVAIYGRTLSPHEVGKLAGIATDPFSFNDQTGMPLGATIVSNAVAITNITNPTAVSITGGEYATSNDNGTSWSDWTNSSDTAIFNKVKVRVLSSTSYGAITSATLTIGDLSDTFSVTTIEEGDPALTGLLAWWRGENNADDSIGGNHGTLKNGATFAAGLVAQAFSLAGTGDYVDAGTNEVFNFNSGAGDFTIQAWVNPAALDRTGASASTIAAKATLNPFSGWSYYIYPDGKLGFGGAGVWEFTSAPGTITTGSWIHVAITRNASAYKLYKNGVEVASTNHGNIETSAAPLKIGSDFVGVNGNGDWGDDRFNGLMDEVQIYDRALSSGEISELAGTKPDAFHFIDQTGMPLSAQIVSNPITVNGTTQPSPISITGGQYQINSNDWTGDEGTVNPGDTVKVRLTSSSTYETTDNATLTIGGVSDTFSVTTAAADDPDATGLAAWWKAEGNALDSVGGNHGEFCNGDTYGTGQIGQAFDFNGTNQCVSVPDGIISNTARHFTVSAWVYTNALTDSVIFYGGANAGEYILELGANGFSFAVHLESSDWQKVISFIPTSSGTWYYVTGVRRGNEIEIWINGVMKNNLTMPDDNLLALGSGFQSRIGSYHSLGMNYTFWNGRIDEVKIYSRALSAAEVNSLAGTRPDAFHFTDQTGVALSTSIESDNITVTGITYPTAISITGDDGEYTVLADNGSTIDNWTSTSGTVSPGNRVKVRLTSSASYSTTDNTTLTIGGVSDTFSVTTGPEPTTTSTSTTTSIAPTTTTSIAATTTVSVTTTAPASTTTTTTSGRKCPLQKALHSQANDDVVNLYRIFRDKRLAQTEAGRRLIVLYYKHFEEVTGILEAREYLNRQAQKLLLNLAPNMFFSMYGDREISITETEHERVVYFLEQLRDAASPALQADIDELLMQLADGTLQSDLGYKVR